MIMSPISLMIVATAPTVYGIETALYELRSTQQVTLQQHLPFTVLKPKAAFCSDPIATGLTLQQHLPFTVCAEGCEAAEEQSDDEVRTSQVPERSEGKTRLIWKWVLPFTVLKPV